MGRREAREATIQALYANTVSGADITETSDYVTTLNSMSASDKEFMHTILFGTTSNVSHIDQLISDYAKGWRIERLSSVDKCILRLAIYELSGGSDAPAEVVINEAVELAKKYSTERSHRFINGILGKIVSDGIFSGDMNHNR